ncbi:MAG: DNA modification methylase [Burkholderiales bacterium]|nr:DNA modification methylase [Burkholderiales bacterium]
MSTSVQLQMFDDIAAPGEFAAKDELRSARSGTFTDNMKLPIHRWFRYSAGFSAEWAEDLIRSHAQGRHIQVLDPFAGSGTTLLAAEAAGVSSVGYESHPFVSRIARAKLHWNAVTPEGLTDAIVDLVNRARADKGRSAPNASPLLNKCFTNDSLASLIRLRDCFLTSPPRDAPLRELVWLSLTAILRSCSHVGTAQWQYVLPNKKKASTVEPFQALMMKAADISQDITFAKNSGFSTSAEVLDQDARLPSSLPPNSIDLIVTSPPYPNNYDYADATRLEMTFWGEIESWGDLQGAVRRHIIRSCSQHSAAERLDLDDLLARPEVAPIRNGLAAVCRELEVVRLTKGGRKTYHTMIAAYFLDLANVFNCLRAVCKKGSRLCFVIGDSAPYGVHAPADQWLGQLAQAAGFKSFSFEKLRDRNIKWKNRKHRVPLQEGRLWIEG